MPQPKRGPGRPPRAREVTRLVVYMDPELKRWLAHRSVDEDRDMSVIVEEAIRAYRTKARKVGR